MDEKQETFPKLLQQSGYQTALIGKWHLETEPLGFDYFSVLPGQGKYFNCPMKVKGQPWGDGNLGGIPTEGYITDVITNQAIDWLKQASSTKPFLLMIHHKALHGPHEYPEKYGKLFIDDLPFPDTFNDNYSGKNPGLKDQNAGYSRLDHIYPNHFTEKVPEGMNSEAYKRWAYQSFFKGYLRLVTSLDENISRLLRYLDESGLSKNTIKPKNWHESIYYHYFSQFEVPEHEGIRTKEYKLIRFYDPKGNSFNEMYHLSNDPGEMKNIYLRQKYKTIKNRLKTI